MPESSNKTPAQKKPGKPVYWGARSASKPATPKPVDSDSNQALTVKIERLELVIEISKQFSATLNINQLMDTILNKVTETLRAEACSFWMKNKQTQEVVCHVAVGPAKDQIEGLRLKSGTGIVGWVIDNKQNTVVFDASKDERFNTKVDEKTKFVTKSMLCVPLIVGDECVGALQLLNKKTANGQFDQQDLEMLELLAMNGAIAIKNAQLFQSERRIKELSALLDMSKEITSTLNLDRVLISIVNLGGKLINFKRALIGLLNADNKVTLAAESNAAQPDFSSSENKQLLAIMNYVMDSGKSLNITNYTKEKSPPKVPQMILNYMDEFKLRCLSLLVLVDSEGKLGIISMEGEQGALVGQGSSYVINLVVNQATVAIRNAQLYQNIPSSHLGEKFRKGIGMGKKLWKKILYGVLGGLLGALFIGFIPVAHNIMGNVEITADHITRVSARVDGVVKDLLFDEGQIVKNGDLLMVLDPSLLELEKAQLQKDRHIILGDLRRLEGEGSAYDIYLKRLELDKLEKQMILVNKNLAFTKITATASGRVLTQKPEELMDKQVVKGEVVAQIAVEDKKAGEILLDEKGVLEVSSGDTVKIVLQAMPQRIIDGTLMYVSQTQAGEESAEAQDTEEGRSQGYIAYFESDGLNDISGVRFGMTGIAKIHTGKKTMYNIYFKPIVERIRTRFKMMML